MTRAKPKTAAEKPLVVCVRRIGKEQNGWTYCGRQTDMYDEADWTFSDPNHAVLSAVNATMKDGRRLEACPECRKVIAAALSGKAPASVANE